MTSPHDPVVKSRADRVRFFLFLVMSGIAGIVNILSRIVLNLAMSYEWAIVGAFLCGMTTAYVLNRMFVFTASGRSVHQEYARFALVNLLAVVQVWIVSVGLARLIFPRVGFGWHAETVAHVIGVVVPAFTSYLAHKHFSFAAGGKRQP